MLVTLAHEGSHAQDHLDHQGALLGAVNNPTAADVIYNGRPTVETSETRAYTVSSVFAQFTLGGAAEESPSTSSGTTTSYKLDAQPLKSTMLGGQAIWKSSWQKSDIATIRANRAAAIAVGLRNDVRYASKLNNRIQ